MSNKSKKILTEISAGELLDKISILEIKLSKINDKESLLEINMNSIKWCMQRLGIETKLVMSSDLSVSGNKSELLANIVRSVSGTQYVSGPSGRNYLEESYFDGISVSFLNPTVENHYSALYNIAIKQNEELK